MYSLVKESEEEKYAIEEYKRSKTYQFCSSVGRFMKDVEVGMTVIH